MVKSVTNKHTPMRESFKQICQEIKVAQVEYKVTINQEIGNYFILMDHQAIALLKEKITHATSNIIFKELNFAKIVVEKFYHQISFGIPPGNSAMVELPGDKYIAECELPLRFCLLCKCWLYQCVVNSVAIPISLVHPRWFYKGPPFVVFWKMSFNLSITFDIMFKLTVFPEKNLQKYPE